VNIFFTSDTHHHHKNILKYCNRPFSSIEEHDAALIDNWNKKVKRGDLVYHLGDFGFAPYQDIKRIFESLSGTVRLLKGNHDRWIKYTRNDMPKNLEWIRDYYELNMNDQKYVLFHYPIGSWNKAHYGSIHLHAHCHRTYAYSHPNNLECGKIIDVGVDCHNYTPVPMEEINRIAAGLAFRQVDNHTPRGVKY
jgi:calcineurin-like phosphoesterase family protein